MGKKLALRKIILKLQITCEGDWIESLKSKTFSCFKLLLNRSQLTSQKYSCLYI